MNKGKRTKKYIIEQSSTVFNKNGYKSTTISNIMTATGLKKGGIYNHFENKDALAKASFTHSFNTLKEIYKKAVTSKKTAEEQFNAFVNVFITLSQDEIVVGGCPLMNAAIEADDSNLEFEDTIKQGFSSLTKLIESIIEYGINHNEIKKEIKPDQMAIFILSSLEGALALTRLYNDKKYLDSVNVQLKELLF